MPDPYIPKSEFLFQPPVQHCKSGWEAYTVSLEGVQHVVGTVCVAIFDDDPAKWNFLFREAFHGPDDVPFIEIPAHVQGVERAPSEIVQCFGKSFPGGEILGLADAAHAFTVDGFEEAVWVGIESYDKYCDVFFARIFGIGFDEGSEFSVSAPECCPVSLFAQGQSGSVHAI